MNASEKAVREHLARIDEDRQTLAHERALLDSWQKSLDREERMARRALEAVDESGQVRLVNPVTGRAHVAQSKPEHRAAVMETFNKIAPAHERRIPQVELERHVSMTSGTLSRAVRDLEAEGVLFRVGVTPRRSPIWSDIHPEADPR